MLKRFLGAACALVLAVGIARAGDATKTQTPAAAKAAPEASAAEKMAAMKAEFLRCAVCKHMAADLDALWPVMKIEIVSLNDGAAFINGVTDPAKAPTFHAACRAMNKAGDACMTMTDEQATADLCGFCQEFRSVLKAGAKMSRGETKTGGIMVLTSADPVVKAKIDAIAAKHAQVLESM